MKQAAGSLQSGRCGGNEKRGWIGVGNGRWGLLGRGIHGDSIAAVVAVVGLSPNARQTTPKRISCV